jgi:hypothetical protein
VGWKCLGKGFSFEELNVVLGRKEGEECCLLDIAVIDCEICVLQILQGPGLKHLAGHRQNSVLIMWSSFTEGV